MKRVIGTLALMLLVFGFCIPQGVHASSKVKVNYKGVTKTYSKKETYIYINGQRTYLSSSPVFMKSGAYVGPLSKIFLKSSLNVQCQKSGDKITLTSNGKSLTMQDGSINVELNGVEEKNALGAKPMQGAVYYGTSINRWIVPLRSVCNRLGFTYTKKNGTIYITDPSYKKPSSDQTDGSSAEKAESGSSIASEPIHYDTSKKVVLVLDAGHGGVDSGARGNGFIEKNMNLAIVLGAKKYFDRDSRFKVLYTRTADTYPSLDDRWKLANRNKADLFICVHINSAYKTSTGTETLFSKPRNGVTAKNGFTSKQLAAAMQRVALNSTGFPNRGLVNRPDLRVLKYTSMPACLIEYGFISNKVEAKLMHANTRRYGRQLYEGIVAYLKTKGRIK